MTPTGKFNQTRTILIEYQNSWPSYVMICLEVLQNALFLITHVF